MLLLQVKQSYAAVYCAASTINYYAGISLLQLLLEGVRRAVDLKRQIQRAILPFLSQDKCRVTRIIGDIPLVWRAVSQRGVLGLFFLIGVHMESMAISVASAERPSAAFVVRRWLSMRMTVSLLTFTCAVKRSLSAPL